MRTVQTAETRDEGWQLQFLGTKFDVTVRELRAQKLQQFMPGILRSVVFENINVVFISNNALNFCLDLYS